MTSLEIMTQGGDKITLGAEAVDALAGRLRGTLLCPDDPAYQEARKVWNGMIDKKPVLIARCRGTADVMAAVGFCKEHRLLLSIRGGGHNVSGSALADGGLVIDLSEMRSVRVMPEKRVAWVEG